MCQELSNSVQLPREISYRCQSDGSTTSKRAETACAFTPAQTHARPRESGEILSDSPNLMPCKFVRRSSFRWRPRPPSRQSGNPPHLTRTCPAAHLSPLFILSLTGLSEGTRLGSSPWRTGPWLWMNQAWGAKIGGARISRPAHTTRGFVCVRLLIRRASGNQGPNI